MWRCSSWPSKARRRIPCKLHCRAAQARPRLPLILRQQCVDPFTQGYKAKFNPDDATAQLVAIYDQHFTQDEIKGLLQFYGSPLGQKFAAEMPKINGEMQSSNRAYSMRIAKDVMKDLRKQY